MVPPTPSVFGFSFTEILSILALLGGIVTTYVSLNARITALEIRVKQFEDLRAEKERKDEQIRAENREVHRLIMEKIDKLIEKIIK